MLEWFPLEFDLPRGERESIGLCFVTGGEFVAADIDIGAELSVKEMKLMKLQRG